MATESVLSTHELPWLALIAEVDRFARLARKQRLYSLINGAGSVFVMAVLLSPPTSWAYVLAAVGSAIVVASAFVDIVLQTKRILWCQKEKRSLERWRARAAEIDRADRLSGHT